MNNLARYRDLRGWTQKDLAELIGVTQSTIQRAETEHASAKLSTYKDCAAALGVSLVDLFADRRAMFEDRVLGIIRRIPEDYHSDLQDLFQELKDRAPEADE